MNLSLQINIGILGRHCWRPATEKLY